MTPGSCDIALCTWARTIHLAGPGTRGSDVEEKEEAGEENEDVGEKSGNRAWTSQVILALPE
jgi:hypothetical protein